MIINTSNNVSFAVYGCLNIEEGNDYNTPLEVKESNETTYSPNISSSSFEPLSDFSELLVQTSYQIFKSEDICKILTMQSGKRNPDQG